MTPHQVLPAVRIADRVVHDSEPVAEHRLEPPAEQARHLAGHVQPCGLACVISPFIWNHHWAWFIPVVVLLLHQALESGRRRFLALPVGLVLLTLDWPVALTTAPDRNTPGIGLIMLNAPEPLALLARNPLPPSPHS